MFQSLLNLLINKLMTKAKTKSTEVPEQPPEPDYSNGYAESNRKTIAFYISIAAAIGLFIYGDIRGVETTEIVSEVMNLAMVYVGGLAVADSVRYYKYGSNTLGNPEKQRGLQDRYKDR